MVLHGVSMGAATVMMTSGDPLPDYVRAFVEDCGYASVIKQFNSNRRDSFWFIPPDVLQSASLVTKKKYGWGFWEASSVKQLAKCERPMLFIHGDADDFVPFKHLQHILFPAVRLIARAFVNSLIVWVYGVFIDFFCPFILRIPILS